MRILIRFAASAVISAISAISFPVILPSFAAGIQLSIDSASGSALKDFIRTSEPKCNYSFGRCDVTRQLSERLNQPRGQQLRQYLLSQSTGGNGPSEFLESFHYLTDGSPSFEYGQKLLHVKFHVEADGAVVLLYAIFSDLACCP